MGTWPGFILILIFAIAGIGMVISKPELAAVTVALALGGYVFGWILQKMGEAVVNILFGLCVLAFTTLILVMTIRAPEYGDTKWGWIIVIGTGYFGIRLILSGVDKL